MIEESIEAVVLRAEQAHASGKQWHFHILSPSCCFNQRIGLYALVVEIPLERESHIAYCADRPAEQGKRLVALLHGAKILQGAGAATQATNEITSSIIARARDLNSHGVAWHHHMLFPDCALNPSPGKWTLLFEDPETGEKLSATYDSEPLNDLREVEVLFYAQQN
jgi:hypothetical protein